MLKTLENSDAVKYVGRNDGVVALALILSYAVFLYFDIKLTLGSVSYIYFQIVLGIIWILFIWGIVTYRRQGLHSLGFKSEALPYMAIFLFTATAFAYSRKESNPEIIGRWFFYLIAVGGTEELLFRGFAHPRLVRLFNNQWAAVIVGGILFGAMHNILPMVLKGASWYGVFSELGGGIWGHLFFLFIYLFTGNILNAIIVHAALDFSKYMPFSWVIAAIYLSIYILNKRNNKFSGLFKDI